MMKWGDLPTHGEIRERTERNIRDMDDREEKVEFAVHDNETVHRTWASLEGATAEGRDATHQAMENADRETHEQFVRAEDDVKEVHESSKECETELAERTETGESDRERLNEADSSIAESQTRSHLLEAIRTVEKDIELLKQSCVREREAREASERELAGLKSRLKNGQ